VREHSIKALETEKGKQAFFDVMESGFKLAALKMAKKMRNKVEWEQCAVKETH